MPENTVPDPPEDAPFPTGGEEETLRQQLEDVRGAPPDDEEIASARREQGPPDA